VRVDLAATPATATPARLRWLAGALLCASALFLNSSRTQAGEKFRITDTPGKVEIPKDPAKEMLPPSDFLHSTITKGDSGQGPVLPAPVQPNLMRNPRLEEWLDRKKNWIFDSPNTLDRDKAVKEVFGVREDAFAEDPKKTKPVMEQFLEGKSNQNSNTPSGREDRLAGKDRNPAQRNSSNPYGSEDDPKRRDSGGIIPALNPAPLFNWNAGPDAIVQEGDNMSRTSILPPGLGEGIFGQRPTAPDAPQATQPRQQMEKVWDTRQLPLSRINDPINAQSDATRFAINPIAARRSSALPEDSSGGAASGPAGFPTAPLGATRPDMTILGRTLPIGQSFAPPTPAAVSTPPPQPKPAILEIPRPRF
jgi:hypothetical protein